MADDPAAFRSKTQAMIAEAKGALQALGRRYIVLLAEDVVERTPGFGNQYAETRYIPTGRLRGGWNWTRAPIERTSKGWLSGRDEDGPFSDYGAETVARIAGQVGAVEVSGISYLENDVAYGVDIVRGEGNHSHIGPRNFPKDTERMQAAIFARALASFRSAP